MTSNGGRSGPRWRAATRHVYAQAAATGDPRCGLCGDPVDLNRPYRNPVTGKVDPKSKSVDHITPITEGGPLYAPANLQLAHLGCQHQQGGHIRANQQEDPSPSPRSRNW